MMGEDTASLLQSYKPEREACFLLVLPVLEESIFTYSFICTQDTELYDL